MINNLEQDIKKGNNKKSLLALFYIDIDNKKYYYTYYKIDETFNDIYNSYQIVDYKKARKLLRNQIYEKGTL